MPEGPDLEDAINQALPIIILILLSLLIFIGYQRSRDAPSYRTISSSPAATSGNSPIPPATYDGKIYLKLRRTQRTSLILQRPIFMLDARVDMSPHDFALIRKYRLGRMIIYDSKTRRAKEDSAASHFDEAYIKAFANTRGSIWSNIKGVTALAISKLTLRVTVDSIIRGQHVQCRELAELLSAEAAFVDACQNLKAYLSTAQEFDGRETLLDF